MGRLRQGLDEAATPFRNDERRSSVHREVQSASQRALQYFESSLPAQANYQPALDVHREYVEPAMRSFREAVAGFSGRGTWEVELCDAEADALRSHLVAAAAAYARRNEELAAEEDELGGGLVRELLRHLSFGDGQRPRPPRTVLTKDELDGYQAEVQEALEKFDSRSRRIHDHNVRAAHRDYLKNEAEAWLQQLRRESEDLKARTQDRLNELVDSRRSALATEENPGKRADLAEQALTSFDEAASELVGPGSSRSTWEGQAADAARSRLKSDLDRHRAAGSHSSRDELLQAVTRASCSQLLWLTLLLLGTLLVMLSFTYHMLSPLPARAEPPAAAGGAGAKASRPGAAVGGATVGAGVGGGSRRRRTGPLPEEGPPRHGAGGGPGDVPRRFGTRQLGIVGALATLVSLGSAAEIRRAFW